MNSHTNYDEDELESTYSRNDPFSYEEEMSEEEKIFMNASHRRPRIEEIEREKKLAKRRRPLNASASIYIDPDNIPDGVIYAWVQAFSQGEGHTEENIHEFKKGGWSPVKAIQHPEIRMLSSEDLAEIDELMSEIHSEYNVKRPVLSRSTRFIRHGGLVLMQKNKQANEMAINRINQQAIKRERAFYPEVFNSNTQPFNMKLSVQ